MADPRIVTPAHAEVARQHDLDPLRLCVLATVALLTWLAGPVALAVFAAIGFAGYLKARRAGLLRSRCKLGDTRLVLLYLGVLVVLGVAGTGLALTGHHVGL